MKSLILLSIVTSVMSFEVLADQILFTGQSRALVSHDYYPNSSSGEDCRPTPPKCGYHTRTRSVCDNSVPKVCVTESYEEYACLPQPDTCSIWMSSGSRETRQAYVNFVNPETQVEIPFIYNGSLKPGATPAGLLIGIKSKRPTEAGIDDEFDVKFFKPELLKSKAIETVSSATFNNELSGRSISFRLKGQVDRREKLYFVFEEKIKKGLFSRTRTSTTVVDASLGQLNAVVVTRDDGSRDVTIASQKLPHLGEHPTKFTIRHLPENFEGFALHGNTHDLKSESTTNLKF